MKKALVVGIDHYDRTSGLTGCVNDALAVKDMLQRHADSSINFGVQWSRPGHQSERIERADTCSVCRR